MDRLKLVSCWRADISTNEKKTTIKKDENSNLLHTFVSYYMIEIIVFMLLSFQHLLSCGNLTVDQL